MSGTFNDPNAFLEEVSLVKTLWSKIGDDIDFEARVEILVKQFFESRSDPGIFITTSFEGSQRDWVRVTVCSMADYTNSLTFYNPQYLKKYDHLSVGMDVSFTTDEFIEEGWQDSSGRLVSRYDLTLPAARLRGSILRKMPSHLNSTGPEHYAQVKLHSPLIIVTRTITSKIFGKNECFEDTKIIVSCTLHCSLLTSII
jgi:hypothetical protein